MPSNGSNASNPVFQYRSQGRREIADNFFP